jgi:hypothetical protein
MTDQHRVVTTSGTSGPPMNVLMAYCSARSEHHSPADGGPGRASAETCRLVDGHAGPHACCCGYEWDA